MVATYVIRIFAPHGRYRVEVSPETSVKAFYVIVAEKCGFQSGSAFYLYTDPECSQKIRRSSSTKVGAAASGIVNGQILYARLSSKATGTPQSTGSVQDQEPSESSDRLAVTQDKGAIKDTAPASASNAGSEPSGAPKFMSFDHFLKDRAYNTVDLPLSMNYKPKPLLKGAPNTIPPSVSLKHQLYRAVDHIEFRNVEEMNRFVQYWRYERDLQEQRAGWLFGYFVDDPHYPKGIRAVVEAIYEPPQCMKDASIVLLPDSKRSTVDRLAATLGLQCVGFLFTHLPREELLTSEEVLRTARYQLDAVKNAPAHYTGYPVSPFVTVTISLDSTNAGVVTNAFMVSDLGMAFVRDDLLTCADDGVKLKLKEQPPSLLVPQVLELGNTVSQIDPHWFIVRVNDSAPKKIVSIFKSWAFPVENRSRPIQISDVSTHLTITCKTAQDPLVPFADFHFILYIAELFDEATANVVCNCVTAREPVDPSLVETLKLLHRSSSSHS